MEAPANLFDVPRLLEMSQPRHPTLGLGYIIGIFLLIFLVGAYVAAGHPGWAGAVNAGSAVLTLLVIGGLAMFSVKAARAHRAEQARLEGLEELIQLRRWQDAAALNSQFLSQPTQSQGSRIQGLIYLSMVLMRYHCFEQAIEVSDYVLEHVQVDPSTEFSIKLARAMAMLRLDQLVDANQAISELRRASEGESGHLALIELYRDVKTGHPEEAVEMADKKAAMMRQQLGYRVGEMYALKGRAQMMLGRTDQARQLWIDATTLIQAGELIRRYPELEPMQRL